MSVADPTGPLIATDGLAAGYHGLAQVRGVSCSLNAGQRLAVVGPNGAGKTTLLRAFEGELKPMAGSLAVGGRPAVVTQREHARLDYPVSALDVALMGSLGVLRWYQRPGRRERAAALSALGRVGLAERADSTFGQLSGGQRQRALLARALVQDAAVLLLDEPFAGLDPASARELRALLARLAAEGRAIVIATHDLELVQDLDLVVCLNHRQIAFGRPPDVLTDDVLRSTYGMPRITRAGARAPGAGR